MRCNEESFSDYSAVLVDLISAFSRGGVAAVVDKVILKGRLKSIGQWMWLSW